MIQKIFFDKIKKYNEKDIIEKIEKEFLNLKYICFFTEKTVNKGMIKEFYLKLLSIIRKNYYLKRILFNLLMILN